MHRHVRLPAAILAVLMTVACACASAQEKGGKKKDEREMDKMIELAEEANRQGITPQELQDRRSGVQRVEETKPVDAPTASTGEKRPARTGPAVQIVTPEAEAAPRQGRSERRVSREEYADVPQWYELPLRVRRDLPELDLTLHYFNEEPGRRFVKLNGERFAEGDQVESRLRVRQIRRDGVVLEFRNDVFLLGRR